MLPLTENQIKISNEYFNLRINQEEELKKFKNSQDRIKKEIKDKLKAKRHISTQLIDNCIKISKYVRAKSNDVDSIFNTIVNSLEQNSNKSKYMKNEELIREYINTILNCKLEMLDIKQQLKIEFNKFKRTHREEIDYDILNILYKDNTNSIEYYNKNEISAEEFKATKEHPSENRKKRTGYTIIDNPSPNGYVYFLTQENKFKIGVSKIPYSRKKTLEKTWGEFDCRSHYYKLDNGNTRKVERAFHKIFQNHNMNFICKKDGFSEFFDISILDECVKYMDLMSFVIDIERGEFK